MTIWPGDEIVGDDGRAFRVERLMAYRGKEGCRNPFCTQGTSATHCYGWHCSGCDQPTSMMGHECPTRKVVES